MGWLDKNVTLEEFEQFKATVGKKLEELRSEIKNSITDDEASAAESALNARKHESAIFEVKNSVEEALNKLKSYSDEASMLIGELQKTIESNIRSNAGLGKEIESNQNLSAELNEAKEKLDVFLVDIAKKHAEIESVLDQARGLPEMVEKTIENAEESKKTTENLQNLLNHAIKKKSEIDELHKKIIGYEVTDSEGEKERIDGLKDELESAYEAVASQAERLAETIQETIKQISDKHNEELKKEREQFQELLNVSSEQFNGISGELKGLMPGAMAAGLSAAYEEKKRTEEKALSGHEEVFKKAILGLIAVLIIPISVDVYLLSVAGMDLVKVIQETPKIVVSIFPVYFPILWLAHSTNKKLNLSKRLIEEYTHKSVLGKTFSGLSNQIENLPNESEVKKELMTRLLFNVLQVSAENPGKLITNYQKSDHPLMEALENSSKLAESVETLSKIPGFSALAKKLAEKGDEILNAQAKKVEGGLAAQEAIEPKFSGVEERKDD